MCKNNASTQTDIVVKNSLPKESKSVIIPSLIIPPVMQSVAIGPDIDYTIGITGLDNIKSDLQMKHFTGITHSFFEILLKFIKCENEGQPSFYKKVSANNRLFLFLTKK